MSKQLAQNVKGTRDFLPVDALKRNWLKKKIISVFEKWGYDPLETPTMEPLEIFEGQVGEDEKLFFKFEDPGGRNVALRYDQTVPTCRVVAQYQNQIVFPFKRYQIQPAFRAEKPQKGRYREFLQCDADIFGVDSPMADAEVIALALDIYKEIGFKQATVLINDRALLKDIPYVAIVAIDKLQKIGESGVIEEMVTKGIDRKQAEDYFSYVMNLKPNETVSFILDYLKNSGFDESWYRFDPTIARSFSYSTGPIYEVVIPGSSGGSVLGGERFDKLVENISGQAIPATGFGLGFDRTLEAAEEFGLVPEFKTLTKVLVSVFSPELVPNSLQAVSELRANGLNTEIFPNPRLKLEKQLKYADQKGIPYVVIVGPDEVAKNVVVLKNLETKEQFSLSITEIIERFK
jgi:histidyl-tRNA synthetase